MFYVYFISKEQYSTKVFKVFDTSVNEKALVVFFIKNLLKIAHCVSFFPILESI